MGTSVRFGWKADIRAPSNQLLLLVGSVSPLISTGIPVLLDPNQRGFSLARQASLLKKKVSVRR